MLTFLPREYYLPLLTYGVTATHPLFGAFIDFARQMSFLGLDKDLMIKLIYNHYIRDTSDPYRLMRQLLDYLADMVFLGPIMNQVSSIHGQSKTYLYYFSRVEEGDLPYSLNIEEYPLISWGAEHGMEMGYVFGYMSTADIPGSSYYNISQADRDLGRMMKHAWVTFAKTG